MAVLGSVPHRRLIYPQQLPDIAVSRQFRVSGLDETIVMHPYRARSRVLLVERRSRGPTHMLQCDHDQQTPDGSLPRLPVPAFAGWVPARIQFAPFGKAATNMGREKGSRWDVGTKDNAITLERFDDDDERVSEDVLEVEEARALAALLTKHADKLESSDDDDSTDEDDSTDDDSEKS